MLFGKLTGKRSRKTIVSLTRLVFNVSFSVVVSPTNNANRMYKNKLLVMEPKVNGKTSENAIRAASERNRAMVRSVDLANSPSTTISNKPRSLPRNIVLLRVKITKIDTITTIRNNNCSASQRATRVY